MLRYNSTTDNISVRVSPVYLDGKSDYLQKRFVFAYFITISNNSPHPVQLRRRFWMIQESDGTSREVEGEGVVGKQPLIQPGKIFRYNSFSVLSTTEGNMEGYYTMERTNGDQFRVSIPKFDLKAMAN